MQRDDRPPLTSSRQFRTQSPAFQRGLDQSLVLRPRPSEIPLDLMIFVHQLPKKLPVLSQQRLLSHPRQMTDPKISLHHRTVSLQPTVPNRLMHRSRKPLDAGVRQHKRKLIYVGDKRFHRRVRLLLQTAIELLPPEVHIVQSPERTHVVVLISAHDLQIVQLDMSGHLRQIKPGVRPSQGVQHRVQKSHEQRRGTGQPGSKRNITAVRYLELHPQNIKKIRHRPRNVEIPPVQHQIALISKDNTLIHRLEHKLIPRLQPDRRSFLRRTRNDRTAVHIRRIPDDPRPSGGRTYDNLLYLPTRHQILRNAWGRGISRIHLSSQGEASRESICQHENTVVPQDASPLRLTPYALRLLPSLQPPAS